MIDTSVSYGRPLTLTELLECGFSIQMGPHYGKWIRWFRPKHETSFPCLTVEQAINQASEYAWQCVLEPPKPLAETIRDIQNQKERLDRKSVV